jgi:hypothetical protein
MKVMDSEKHNEYAPTEGSKQPLSSIRPAVHQQSTRSARYHGTIRPDRHLRTLMGRLACKRASIAFAFEELDAISQIRSYLGDQYPQGSAGGGYLPLAPAAPAHGNLRSAVCSPNQPRLCSHRQAVLYSLNRRGSQYPIPHWEQRIEICTWMTMV